jgi:hypothetical protein
LTYSLLLLTAVTVITAWLTGGIGVRSLGSSQYGGGKYVTLLAGIAGYFALTSRRIPPNRAGLYVACFFLSGMTYGIATLAIMAGPQFHFLMSIFSPMYATRELSAEGLLNEGMARFGGLQMIAIAVYLFMLARFGVRGLLDTARPWRLVLFLLTLGVGLYGGFRSYAVLFGLTFGAMFLLEGLHRTRVLAVFLGVGLLGSAVILPQAYKLPMAAQRALSFLPGKFDPVAIESARTTIEWRVDMWKQLLPGVPQYLFRGKGLSLDPTDMYLAGQSERRFQGGELSGTIAAGDYHNGPLSILIPFGIYGMIAFLWFLIAGVRLLHRNFKFGNPAYRNVNTLLLAAFVAHAFFFFIFFGSLCDDTPFFAGLLGLSVALNGADAPVLAQAEQPAGGVELNTEYIRV